MAAPAPGGTQVLGCRTAGRARTASGKPPETPRGGRARLAEQEQKAPDLPAFTSAASGLCRDTAPPHPPRLEREPSGWDITRVQRRWAWRELSRVRAISCGSTSSRLKCPVADGARHGRLPLRRSSSRTKARLSRPWEQRPSPGHGAHCMQAARSVRPVPAHSARWMWQIRARQTGRWRARKTSVHVPREAPGPTGRHATKFRDTERKRRRAQTSGSEPPEGNPLSGRRLAAWALPPSGLLGAPLGEIRVQGRQDLR